ncbi:MAG: hypothetical protein WCX73_01000 [Candidatus Pacearchaeota archaeon]|jgi:hypothetical protein
METRHVRLDYAQTLSAKKELLSSEIDLIYTAKALSKYKQLRKKEFILKNQLKISLAMLKIKLNLLSSTFPVTKRPTQVKRIIKKETIEEKNLSEELQDIQTKLARLQ